ncbi:MAG: HlyD family secretion protein [Sphingobacteriales bacterium]|jgi:HlyD family secretion protein
MSNKLIKYLTIAVIALIVLAVIGKKSGWFGNEESIKISVEKVEKRTIIESVSASGKIQPEVEVKISADVSGEIVGLFVKEGDKVKKGDLLLKIRPDMYTSAVERAAASLNSAKANLANSQARLIQFESRLKIAKLSFDRSQQLYKDKIISDADYETAQSNFEVAEADYKANKETVEGAKYSVQSSEASLKESKENLTKTTIFAPVDGTISVLNVEVGERVVGTLQMTGTEILRVANLTTMEVSLEVNENDINRVSLNDTAIVEVDAFPENKFLGVVTEIASSANLLSNSPDQITNFEVKVRILPDSYAEILKDLNRPSPFRPGMSATVDIQTEVTRDVLAIPIQSVTLRLDTAEAKPWKKKNDDELEVVKKDKKNQKPQEYVFIVASGKVEMVAVKTGIQDDTYISVSTGIEEGTQVVSAPYMAISKLLKNGSPVEIVSKEKLYTQRKDN